jgi:ABC-type transport system substrate-binding protein
MERYPVQFEVAYPDRPLNRLTTLLRPFMLIPILIVLAAIEGVEFSFSDPDGQAVTVVASGVGLLFLPPLLLILFRRRYPRWWFDWNLNLLRFANRIAAYAALMDDRYAARYDGPFGEAANVAGLAQAVRPRAGGARWDVRLRSGVRFHDGSPLNGAAVLANAHRWLASARGRELLPGLIAADSPRPDLVRFFFAEPRTDVPELLAATEFGIVAPSALRTRPDGGAGLSAQLASGSGPFELRERSANRLLLAHNTEWWGSERDLGPALDQVQFRVIGPADARVRALHAGEVRVASGLTRAEAQDAAADPLTATVPEAGEGWIAYELSVRGLGRGREVPSLAGVWIASLGE